MSEVPLYLHQFGEPGFFPAPKLPDFYLSHKHVNSIVVLSTRWRNWEQLPFAGLRCAPSRHHNDGATGIASESCGGEHTGGAKTHKARQGAWCA